MTIDFGEGSGAPYDAGMSGTAPDVEGVRAAEVVASVSLATDLGMGFPLEHSLGSTIIAMRLADRLGADAVTARQAYYGSLLAYVGCTADAEVAAGLFEAGALLRHFAPVMYGTPRQTMAGVMRALGGSRGPSAVRAIRGLVRLPAAGRGHRHHQRALCEVGQLLTDGFGLPPSVTGLFAHLTERWDGKGGPAHIRGESIPLALRIVHVAADAAVQRMLGGPEFAARVIAERAGHAFDPAVVEALIAHADELLAPENQAATDDGSAWDTVLSLEPRPTMWLRGDEIDQALVAVAAFTDLISPYLVGHSTGVAELAAAAAQRCRLDPADVAAIRRAGYIHDVGRVAIAAHVWQKPAPLTADEREQVRLHPYYTERILSRSPFLSAIASAAASHHERVDGTGYHRSLTAPALPLTARILAAADAYQAMTAARPYRQPLRPDEAARELREDAVAGRLASDAVNAVLEVAGHAPPKLARPAGLTEREVEVLVMLARGWQTKQVARALGISVKTADRHVQNAYRKIGVSTRAAAAVFAMHHGLASWGELPIEYTVRRS